MTKTFNLTVFSMLIACVAATAFAVELPPPAWVSMFDQGEADLKLKGIETPRGVKVEIVADTPRIAVFVYDGWSYHVEDGKVIRRGPVDAEALKTAQLAAEAKQGPPTIAAADNRWIEQELIRGLSAKPSDATGGLTLGLDGWMYLSIGGVANRAESWDGSKATVLGSGAIFRFRPNGSNVQEFARGLASPAGPPAFDAVGNLFQCENNSTGSRLVHMMELGDYGWRNDWEKQRLDRPGTLPAMLPAILTSEAKNVGGAIVYSGEGFPAVFQRLVLVPEQGAHAVRAYVLVEQDATFVVEKQFDLIRTSAEKFRPTQAIQGPDGSIYVAEASGRVLRLTWSGTKEMPAIPLKALADLPLLDAAPTREAALAGVLDATKPIPARASALAAACRQWDASVLDACLTLLKDQNTDLARLAADAIGDHLPDDKPTQEDLAGVMQQHLLRSPPAVQRSLYLALGKLGTKLDTVPEWIFEATSVTPQVQANRHTFDGHVRATEIPKGWATELMISNLDVALFDPNPEPEERQRLKLFVTTTAEAMRTRELTDFLDHTIRDEKDYFSKLDAPLQARLLAAYQNVLVEPPARADAVALWLSKHPSATSEVQRAAWETLAVLGTEKSEMLVTAAKAALAGKPDAQQKALIAAALTPHRVAGKRSEVDDLLDQLKAK